jgi:hypothetical protein
MVTCNFYAAREDMITVLDFVFEQPGASLVELASRHDLPLRRFSSTAEVESAFALGVEDVLLLMYASSMGAPILERHVRFDRRYVPDAVGRTDAMGWGLIQVYLRRRRGDSLCRSRIGNRSQRSARRYEPVLFDELGSVDAWDWAEIERISSRVARFIRRTAVAKLEQWPVMPRAATAAEQGARLSLPDC